MISIITLHRLLHAIFGLIIILVNHSMRCIFCKKSSSLSKSIEHIIPESLGNTDHILPIGVVCDRCNNYFSRKIEKPLLDLYYFKYTLSRNRIPSKKGRFRSSAGLHLESGAIIEILGCKNGWSVYPSSPSDDKLFINCIKQNIKGSLIIPNPTNTASNDRHIVSRFLSKVAIEVLALRVLNVRQGIDEIVDKPELDTLRNYARFGDRSFIWPYHERRIYPESGHFISDKGEPYEILHEFTLLYTEECELFLVVAIFGIEYALNLAAPEIDGYLNWLKLNDGKSPLTT